MYTMHSAHTMLCKVSETYGTDFNFGWSLDPWLTDPNIGTGMCGKLPEIWLGQSIGLSNQAGSQLGWLEPAAQAQIYSSQTASDWFWLKIWFRTSTKSLSGFLQVVLKSENCSWFWELDLAAWKLPSGTGTLFLHMKLQCILYIFYSILWMAFYTFLIQLYKWHFIHIFSILWKTFHTFLFNCKM